MGRATGLLPNYKVLAADRHHVPDCTTPQIETDRQQGTQHQWLIIPHTGKRNNASNPILSQLHKRRCNRLKSA